MAVKPFKAILMEQDGASVVPHLRDLTLADLPPGDVLVRVHYSSLNFKDALALANKGIIRKFPAVAGIDIAGVVVESSSPDYAPGDSVVLTGLELGDKQWGGYAEYARVKSAQITRLPTGMSLLQSMQVGTAGVTAMMCVDALQRHDVLPNTGPVAVTGASGGVGSIAVSILSRLGYAVCAITGRVDQTDTLKALGASTVVLRQEDLEPSRPGRSTLESETFAGAIDTVGGDTLAALIARIKYGGSVAACGLVGGTNLDTTVFPFILRGVNLLGIDMVRCPVVKRAHYWKRIVSELPFDLLTQSSRTIALDAVIDSARQMHEGLAIGRTVVDLGVS